MRTLLGKLPILGVALAVFALAAAFFSGTGHKMGLWDFRFGLKLIEYAIYAGLAAGFLGLLGLIVSFVSGAGSKVTSAIALIIGGGIGGFLAMQVVAAGAAPMIHDITTDMEDPPIFVEVVALRGPDSNTLDYENKMAPLAFGKPEKEFVVVLQAGAYPQIKPLLLERSIEDTFALAEDLVAARGWELVSANMEEGRIEATDTTKWFGFKDDVVLRLRSEGEGTRVDMRSVSRVGMSDTGLNAARIEAFLADLKAAAEG
jgi:uncharacterized protein (DUF1499 family)